MKRLFTKPMQELNYIEALTAAIISSGIILGGIAAVAKIHDIVTSHTRAEVATMKEATIDEIKED